MHDTHNDRVIHLASRALVICSMCLSGYFGWTIAEGVPGLNVVLMVFCACAPVIAHVAFEAFGFFSEVGSRARSVRWFMIGAFFIGVNVLFDYSSAAVLRDSVATAATNANHKADDVRTQIKLLKKNIEDAKATTAWQTQLKPAEAYEGEIRNLESNQTIMKRSKNCVDQTLPDTKAHCQAITDAKANLAMAQQKRVFEGSIGKWEKELGQLVGKAETTDFHSNAALAQVKSIVSWAVRSRNLSDDNVFWGQNAIMLLMTAMMNLGIAFLAIEMGSNRALSDLHHEQQPSPRANEPRRLTYYNTPGPQPLHAQPAPAGPSPHHTTHNETVIIAEAPSTHVPRSDPAIDDLLRRSKESADAVRARLASMRPAGSA